MIQTQVDIGEILMHHTADAYSLDFSFFTLEWHAWPWAEFHLFGITFNLTPTKHVVFMLLAATLLFLTMWSVGRILERQRAGQQAPRGFANGMEAFVLWLRHDLVITNIGPHDGPRFAPYILTLFFFILYSNLLGLLPWGATATGNLGVTAALAIMALFTIELSGLFKLGFRGYMRTIFPALPGMGGAAGLFMSIAMGPIEVLGKLVKPFALCFRLFGNMTAGHFVMLTLFGLIFMFGNLAGWRWAVGVASATLVLGVMALEIIVAFVQAYVFAIITAVLIGMMQHEH
jgi:F-type H+-transporting ATPase subunit a